MTEATQLSVPERVRTALSVVEVEAEFRTLAESSKSLTVITNDASYQEIHSARMRLVKARTNTVKRGKAVREDAQAFAKAVIAEENRLIGIIEPEEKRLQALQDAEDAKREAKIAAERKRVEEIEQRITAMQDTPLRLVGEPATEIAAAIEAMKSEHLHVWAMEFLSKAEAVKGETLTALEQLHAGAVATEKAAAEEKARAQAEREELARLRAEQTKRDAEAAEAAKAEAARQAEARAKLEAEERAAREAREAEDRKAQAERDRLDREAKERREAEEARLRAEQERVAAERNRIEEQERASKKAEEERVAEIRRQEIELMDGQTLLITFRDRYGKRREFGKVVKAIDDYLATKQARAA